MALLAAASAPQGSLTDFERLLASTPSATAALASWCASQHLADPATIRALRVKGEDALPPPDLDETLALPEGQEAGYRHVRLVCGAPDSGVRILSEAHNWYAPQRLTEAMRQTLDTTDTPFGKAVAALNYSRERLASVHGVAAGCPAGTVLAHRALLRLPDGAPLALVVECYTGAILGK